MRNYLELLGLSDAELASVDPMEMNLLVASVSRKKRIQPIFWHF
jgi:hypothetical protein